MREAHKGLLMSRPESRPQGFYECFWHQAQIACARAAIKIADAPRVSDRRNGWLGEGRRRGAGEVRRRAGRPRGTRPMGHKIGRAWQPQRRVADAAGRAARSVCGMLAASGRRLRCTVAGRWRGLAGVCGVRVVCVRSGMGMGHGCGRHRAHRHGVAQQAAQDQGEDQQQGQAAAHGRDGGRAAEKVPRVAAQCKHVLISISR